MAKRRVRDVPVGLAGRYMSVRIRRAKPIHLFAIDGDTGQSMTEEERGDMRGKCRYHIEPEYRTSEEEYNLARDTNKTFESWQRESEAVWTDDAGEWGLRSYKGYKLTAIVHYCTGSAHGEFTGGLTGERCAQCRVEASDEVIALRMLLHPNWYAKEQR